MIHRSFLFIGFLSFFSFLTSPEPGMDGGEAKAPAFLEERAFAPGEQFTLKLYYNWSALWVASGELSFRISADELEGRPVYHLLAIGKTYAAYNHIYRVADRYESYVDTQSLLPVRAKRRLEEGRFRLEDKYLFDRKQGRVAVQEFVRGDRGEYDIEHRTMDILSMIQVARNLDFDAYRPGDRIAMSLFIDKELMKIELIYEGEKEIKTRNGRFRSIVLRQKMADNEYFDENDYVTIYVSDDRNRIPLRIESPLTVGWVKGELKSYRGLKYPLQARIR